MKRQTRNTISLFLFATGLLSMVFVDAFAEDPICDKPGAVPFGSTCVINPFESTERLSGGGGTQEREPLVVGGC